MAASGGAGGTDGRGRSEGGTDGKSAHSQFPKSTTAEVPKSHPHFVITSAAAAAAPPGSLCQCEDDAIIEDRARRNDDDEKRRRRRPRRKKEERKSLMTRSFFDDEGEEGRRSQVAFRETAKVSRGRCAVRWLAFLLQFHSHSEGHPIFVCRQEARNGLMLRLDLTRLVGKVDLTSLIGSVL